MAQLIDSTTAPVAALAQLQARITDLKNCRAARGMPDAVFAALYFLHWQMERHGSRFAARTVASDARPDVDCWQRRIDAARADELPELLSELLARYQFRGVKPGVTIALGAWLRNAWTLVLRADIPAPLEVLRMQTRGARPVTVLTDPQRMLQPVLTKADAFAFLLHDLEHAHKFFHDPRLHALQRALLSALAVAVERRLFDAYLNESEFRARFDYLISDMNTHPLHSLHYLRAILVDYHLRRELCGLRGPLSVHARADVARVLRALGECGGLGAAADAALRALSDGGAGERETRAIEDGLVASSRVPRAS
jgi:hypothetical protein